MELNRVDHQHCRQAFQQPGWQAGYSSEVHSGYQALSVIIW
jgi:hypothetical protein